MGDYKIKLDTRSKWSDEQYIGYVLEVINRYLGWGMKEYNLGGIARLTERGSAVMINDRGDKIKVRRLEGKCYAVEGWPEEVEGLPGKKAGGGLGGKQKDC